MKWASAICSDYHIFGSNQVQLRFLLGRDLKETISLLVVAPFENTVPDNPENSAI